MRGWRRPGGRSGCCATIRRPSTNNSEGCQHSTTPRSTVSGPLTPLAPEVSVCLYRVTQEALTNIVKHASGARTSVGLSYTPDHISVTVENEAANGSSALRDSGGGYGLQGITERLALLGGHMEAGLTPEGWRVTATVPIAASAVARENPVAP